jgi:ABC-2 type transport system ATP-binding protein
MLSLEELTKQFEDLVAVNNLNLSIQAGEVFAFLGPNGAGKTTTIKMITGLLNPTKGRVVVGEFDVQKNPVDAKRLIGYIPDQPYVYEKLSGREFFYFIGELFNVPKDVVENKMKQYFDLFGLTPSMDKLVENYSHGMRQKLVISAALMHAPRLLVVDEPMVGLDPQSARQVKQIFRSQGRDHKTTVFLSTHTLSVAEEVADRIGIINHGNLLFVGTKEQLKEQLKRDGTLEDLFLELTGDKPQEQYIPE